MKKIVLVLTIALMGTIVMNAHPSRRHGNPEEMVKQRVEHMAKALNLTETQKAEITKIYTVEMESMAKERPAKHERGQKPDEAKMKAMHEKMKAQREATDAKIEALLTPEQAAKYAEFKKHMGKRGHGKKHGVKRDGVRPERGQGSCCDSGNKSGK